MRIINRYGAFLILIFVGLLLSSPLLAQKPIVKTVVRNTGSMDNLVSISGLNFGTDMTKLVVFFGGAKATLVSASDQLLEVLVPNGATFNSLTVTRFQSTPPGLTAFSSNPFLLSFGGQHPFNTANLEAQKDYPAEKGLYEICTCDFDGDNDLDLATANKESTNVTVVQNTSTPGTINFAAPTLIPIGAKTLQIRCGDLNGDGMADLIVSGGDAGNQLFILQNLGGTFSMQSIAMDLVGVLNIRIGDLDLDGKPDLVVSHSDNTTLEGKVWVLQNQTVSSAIVFSTPISFKVPEAVSTDGVDIADLDGDSYPEIITSQRQVNASNLYIIKNNSSPGNLALGVTTKLTAKGVVIHVRAADMDGDQKPDIVVTQVLNSTVSIFRNTSTLSNFTFDAPVSFATEASPWGMDLGDLDGDGKVDITVCSVNKTNLTILNNESVGSTLSFTKLLQPTLQISRHPLVGDIDGDGKPDIAFTTIDDITLTKQRVSVFRNGTCMIPQVKPDTLLALCTGTAFKLFSNVSKGSTYTWKNTTTNTVVGTNDPFFTIPTTTASSSKYAVTISPQAGGISCPTASAEVTVNVSNGTATAPTFVSPTGPICVGSTLNLEVKNDGFKYVWSGPNNYSGTTYKPAPITNFQSKNAGRYYVNVMDALGLCLAQRSSIVVEIIDALDFSVSFPGTALTCLGSKSLAVSPTPSSATYQWFEKTSGNIGGATSTTLSVTATGEYGVQVTLPGCNPANTTPIKISLASAPIPDFSFSPSPACAGQNVKFKNLTSIDNQLDTVQNPLIYTWSFGDGTSSDKNPIHKYSAATTASITLKATYMNGDAACVMTSGAQSLIVNPAPSVSITNSLNEYNFCPGDSLKLDIIGGPFDSYKWSTNEISPSIYVKLGGKYSAEVVSGSCTLNAESPVVTVSETLLSVTATPESIAEGASTQLEATGLLSYTWSPTDLLSDASLPNPVATPATTTTYMVTGPDTNGCTETGSIQITVKGASITSKLNPNKLLSPNGLPQYKLWNVDKIEEYPQCSVAIYDDKGIKVYEAKPYNNDWDGTFKGSRLPDGVYYYIIRCDGEEGKPRSGSITLLR
ncbi:MAG TPA: FG-GAP-like repeat-containing protein [Cyclobacteriaceae bacterium]|nr:FG-GAP-like repeat-containing protein [Cyclobacteriaceae bacterium]